MARRVGRPSYNESSAWSTAWTSWSRLVSGLVRGWPSPLVRRMTGRQRGAVRTSPSPAGTRDDRWVPLYRAGAVSAAAAVLLYAVALVIVTVSDPPPDSGGAATLDYVATHRTVYILRQVLWQAPGLFMMVVILALAVALRRYGPSLAAVAGTIGVSSWAISLAWPTTGDGSLAMVLLSDRYTSATTAAEQASMVAGADLLTALNDMPAVIGVLQTLGVLLIGLLMLRGPFGKALAWLGVATGAVGVASEVLRPVLGMAYAVYGLMLFVWLAWVAVALWRHAQTVATPSRVSDPSTGPLLGEGPGPGVKGRAVARVQGEVTIGRPVGVVFDYVADQTNEPQYNPSMVRAEKIGVRPLGVGTRFSSAVRTAGRTVDMVIEVLSYDRPRLLASRTVMKHAEIDYILRFEPVPAGTRMRWSGQVRPTGALRLLAPAAGWLGRRQEHRIWQTMRRLLEGDTEPGGSTGPDPVASGYRS